MYTPGLHCLAITQAVAVDHLLSLACALSHQACIICGVPSAAGTQSGSTSNANINKEWLGNIALSVGTWNVTIDYHNGNGDGYLVIRAGYNTASESSNVSLGSCAFDVQQRC